jgi:hypothetical protein
LIGSKAALAGNEKDRAYQDYRDKLISGFWNYRKARFQQEESLFEQESKSEERSPVFLKWATGWNVLIAPDASEQKRREVLETMPRASRHRWFRALTSTQALTQSVFGNLKVYASLHSLRGLLDHQGLPLFDSADLSPENVSLEHSLTLLNDPDPLSIDVLMRGPYRIAMECALTEQDIGRCSNVSWANCDGSYTAQMGRRERCYLTSKGIQLWEQIPKLFSWSNGVNHKPCPLHNTYQLVRRVLAASIGPDGRFSLKHGHALLIYDDRNPVFQKGGRGFEAYESIKAALRYPALFRKCSWQRLIGHLRGMSVLPWLTTELQIKYGL